MSGEARKSVYGPWVMTLFRWLSRAKGLRGTALDPFGHSAERKMERALIAAYESTVAELIERLDASNSSLAVQIASIPEEIRGFGHVKRRHLEAAKRKESELLVKLRQKAAGARVPQTA